jgi:hypothetical protein
MSELISIAGLHGKLAPRQIRRSICSQLTKRFTTATIVEMAALQLSQTTVSA